MNPTTQPTTNTPTNTTPMAPATNTVNTGVVDTGAAGAPAADPADETPTTDTTAPDDSVEVPEVDVMDEPEVEEPVSTTGFPAESSCLDGITDFNSTGPFDYSAETAGAIKLWVPDVPADCKVPIVHLANGTGGRCSSYQNVLNRLASHGFLTVCYESTQTGAGTQGVEAFETALSMYPDLAANRLGSTGHSQGGQAAFTVLQQAEVKFGAEFTYAGLAMEPASGFGDQPPGMSWQEMYSKILSPMFMFSGTSDTLVSRSWVSRGFAALSDDLEAYHWSARGATHVPTPQEETMEVSVPWFRWKLLNDQEACRAFKALEGAGTWSSVEEQNVEECQ